MTDREGVDWALLEHTQARIDQELSIRMAREPAPFRIEQIDVDIHASDRCLAVNLYSTSGERLFVAVTFDETTFDYDGFSRSDWRRELEMRFDVGQTSTD